MTIPPTLLLAALRDALSRCPYISDFRKVSGSEGAAPRIRLVRFIDWRRVASAARRR